MPESGATVEGDSAGGDSPPWLPPRRELEAVQVMDPLLAPRPQPVRRHSTAVPARRLSRPYRSSPLAGPALSPSGALADPPRVSSSPNLNTLSTLPPRRATVTARSEHVPRPSTSPAPSTPPSKRSSLSLRFSRRASYSPSTSASSSSSSSSSSPPPPVPDLPSRRRRCSIAAAAAAPSTSRDPAENWLSATAAPKFSRLGLAADGVVLPVSAKAYAASISSRRDRPERPSSPISVRSADSADSRSALSLARRPSDTSLDTSPPASTGSSSRSPRVHWSPSPDDQEEGDATTAITPAAVAPGKRPRPRSLRRAWNKLLLALRVPRVRAP
ncbi:hypothetical protein HETIRDRAFT_460507 [Heterobasidion irregulare TC 32-1]|uniref:Uncharacterized protein n=1 Tax=Heterobasidion irregulare (strain TC 32-1) TaxID=747525 RepID=W4JU01_HETIT|nr:uncharacterized protein HETIRDRAFT_460507 [Heterobasidion irregulare TC 32-1]ETW77033.1 hypothetical protein HETIRDRAFT_460507 [Heterobasidion irregulare TC 32-1]